MSVRKWACTNRTLKENITHRRNGRLVSRIMGFRSVLRLLAGAESRLTGDTCPGTANSYGVLQ